MKYDENEKDDRRLILHSVTDVYLPAAASVYIPDRNTFTPTSIIFLCSGCFRSPKKNNNNQNATLYKKKKAK